MLLITSAMPYDPYCFVLVDEAAWEVVERRPGGLLSGAATAGDHVYALWSDDRDTQALRYRLVRMPILAGGRVGKMEFVSPTVIPDGHSLTWCDRPPGFLVTVSVTNEMWLLDKNGLTAQRIAPTGRSGQDHSHLNGLCRDDNGSWYLSMLAWHRTDRAEWRTRRRLGLILRIQDLFDDGDLDVLIAGLDIPHSPVWVQGEPGTLWYCNSNRGEIHRDGRCIASLPDQFARGLLVDREWAYVGANPMRTTDTTQGAAVYRAPISPDSPLAFRDRLHLGTPDQPISEIFDILKL